MLSHLLPSLTASMLGAFFGMTNIVILVVCCLIIGYPIFVMSQKKGIPNEIFGFIPILNAYQLIQIAGLPVWYLILLFIPCVNLFVGTYIWMKVAGAMGKEEWMGLLMLIPVVGLFVPYWLAGLIGG